MQWGPLLPKGGGIIHVHIGWSPASSTWTYTLASFSFSILLIVAQFTIFSSFLGPKLLEPFLGHK